MRGLFIFSLLKKGIRDLGDELDEDRGAKENGQPDEPPHDVLTPGAARFLVATFAYEFEDAEGKKNERSQSKQGNQWTQDLSFNAVYK